MRGWLSNLLIFLVAFRIVSTLYKWQIRRSAHVQRALLVRASQDITSLAGDCVNVIYVSEHIAKVVQCITCVAGASTMQSLATSLTRFAKTVSASVAIAQAVVLAATTKNGCTEKDNHRSNPKTWCSSCKAIWTCSQCGGQASASTKPPTGPVCYDCSQSEEVALDSFAERNCLEYFFLGQEDDVMLEWFENTCAEFETLCDDFNNVG